MFNKTEPINYLAEIYWLSSTVIKTKGDTMQQLKTLEDLRLYLEKKYHTTSYLDIRDICRPHLICSYYI